MAQTQKLPGIVVFRGNTKEVEAQPIIDRQFVFDTEKKAFFIDTKGNRVKCGQDASEIEKNISDIQDKINSGSIISKDEINKIIAQATQEKQNKIKFIDDILYREQWDLLSTDGDMSVHEYYYNNPDIEFGSELQITPITETIDEYNSIIRTELFPAIDTYTDNQGKHFYLIRAKNVPDCDIKIHISVLN